MKLIYGIKDKPKFGKLIVFAFQQLLAIMAATIAVPMITSGVYDCGNVQMSTVAALFGAGAGTLIYVLFTKAKSPVFLGSSFAFLGSMAAAFAGATTVALGFLGLILGAVFAGLVYVVLAIAVKISGVNWINRLMPARRYRTHSRNYRTFARRQRYRRPAEGLLHSGRRAYGKRLCRHCLRTCHSLCDHVLLRLRQEDG